MEQKSSQMPSCLMGVDRRLKVYSCEVGQKECIDSLRNLGVLFGVSLGSFNEVCVSWIALARTAVLSHRRLAFHEFSFFCLFMVLWAEPRTCACWLWWQVLAISLPVTCSYSRFDKLVSKTSHHNGHVQTLGSNSIIYAFSIHSCLWCD